MPGSRMEDPGEVEGGGAARGGAAGARERLLLAIAAGCAAAVIGYAAARCAEAALLPEANPRAVIGAARSPFAWRCALALHAGGMGAIGGAALAGRWPEAAGRWVARAAIAAAIAIAAQGALLP